MFAKSWAVGLLTVVIVALTQPPAELAAQVKDGLKFEVYKDTAGEFRWRLVATDGKVLATAGQGYQAKASAVSGVKLIQGEADGKLKFEVYEDKAKEHRWRAKSPNGQVVASSATGYKDRAACEKVVETIKKGASKASVEEVKK
jgi:uncharacterized protein YegP (UPF0339 family)